MEPEVPMALHSSRLKWLLVLLGSSIFVAVGISALATEKLMILAIIFFGLGVVISLVQILPNASNLKLTTAGMLTRSLYKEHKINWRDVAEFGVMRIGLQRKVAWRYTAEYLARSKSPVKGQGFSQWKGKLASHNRKVFGWDACLPDNYGMRAAKLADLLKRLHARYAPGSN